MSGVFYYTGFNDCDLDKGKTPLREKFNEIIKDLEGSNRTSQGNIKLIKGDGNIQYFRAKLSDSDRLLFTSIKYKDKGAFVILEVILNHDYQKSKFLTNKDKIRNIKITDQNSKEVSDIVEIEDTPQVCWLGNKIFEEFTAVIAGGNLKKEQYKDLGKRQAIFSEEKRGHIYGLFEEYKEFIEKDSECYDPNLIADKCTEEKIYDAVVVDEVQDLTGSTLSLILKSLKDESKGNFLLCGDVNQVVHPSFFSLSKLKSFLYQNQYIRDQGSQVFYALEKNYRNSEQVIELANRVLHLKNYCFASEDKMTVDNAFFMKSDTKNKGNVGFVADDKKEEIAEKVCESINWAVLVLDDESKENVRQLFDTPLVFNIHEAKGLEFENIILYKFTSHKAYDEVCKKATDKKKVEDVIYEVRDLYDRGEFNTSRSRQKEDKSFEKYKFYMNALYVGVSRAIDGVYIIDDEKKCNLLKVIKPKRMGNIDIKAEESSPEEWKVMALELIDKGNIEQAEKIAKKLLKKEKKEYVEEIMNALEAKGYHKERAVSELKTDPQKPSMSASKVPKNKKSQGKKHQNEKKKLTKEELKSNTNKLFSALKNSNLQLAKKLIGRGVNVDARDKVGNTPLNLAAQNGHENVVALLLKQKEVDVNVQDQVQNVHTPLHTAAKNGHENVVKLLLEHKKIDVNSRIQGDFTPLHGAAYDGRENVVKLLLQCGANVNTKNQEGFTSLHAAAQNGHENVVELLLKHKEIDVNAQGQGVYTPLHLAAQQGHKKVVKLLLEHKKIDVNSRVHKGFTPLHAALQKSHKDVVELLLKHKEIDVNAKNHNGLTPLHSAISYGSNEDIVRLLVQHGADVNAETVGGFTPLYAASEKGHKNIVEFLLKQKEIDINCRTKESLTPLCAASKQGDSEIVDLLLADSGINVSCTKIVFAKKKEDREKILQKLGQDDKLFNLIKQAAEIDENKVDELLEKIKNALKSKNKYGFKPSLNYSPDSNNTTTKIAIKAGGEVLHLLYDYAEKEIGVDTKIFKQLKHAKKQQESSQPKSDISNVSISSNLTQEFKLD